jgi:hypothetical protein
LGFLKYVATHNHCLILSYSCFNTYCRPAMKSSKDNTVVPGGGTAEAKVHQLMLAVSHKFLLNIDNLHDSIVKKGPILRREIDILFEAQDVEAVHKLTDNVFFV